MKLILLFALVGTISCAFKDHAKRLYIGVALSPSHFSDSQYKSLAAAQYNCLTPENEMKIDATEPQQNQFSFNDGDQLVTFAQQNGMKIRGHTLVWHSQVPSWMSALSGNTLIKAMENHISKVAGHYKGKIYAWDVLNEIFAENGELRDSIWSKTGSSFVATALKAARAADPSAKLYINDYNVEGINAKSTGLYNLVKKLKSEAVPIDGVGIQSHFTVGQIASDFEANLKRFSDLGVDVAVTELDIGTGGQSESVQATAYANAVSACKNVSRCVGVTIWGLTDKYSWRESASPLPWNANYKAKAAVSSIEKSLA